MKREEYVPCRVEWECAKNVENTNTESFLGPTDRLKLAVTL